MKTNYLKLITKVILSSILLVFIACNKNEDQVIPEQQDGELTKLDGITKEDLKASKGEIGVIIDARNVAKKGYLPASVVVEINATQGDYSQTLALNEFTNIASISLKVEELSEAALAELKEGVSATIEIKDKDGNILVTENFSKFSFKENGTHLVIKANDLASIAQKPSFNPNIPYYFQIVMDGKPTNRAFHITEGTSPQLKVSKTNFEPNGNATKFYIVQVPDYDTYYIKTEDNYYLGVYPTTVNFESHQLRPVKIISDAIYLALLVRFKIKTGENGEVYLESYLDKTVDYLFYDWNTDQDNWNVYSGTSNGSILYPLRFRIIPANIQWQMETIGTEYMQPIYPAASTSFGFNSTLSNCSPGTLEQEVGIEINKEKTATMGWEESVELTSESTYEVSASLEMSSSVSFFGNGVDVTASASSSYSVTKGMTTTNTGFGEKETVEAQTFFSTRSIEVLPQTAVLVYDAYQTYSNITVPFVQRYRVRGTDTQNNETLTGEQIVSQFRFNNFDGVITHVGEDFVEITVRSTTKIDNLIETQSEVKEVESNCN